MQLSGRIKQIFLFTFLFLTYISNIPAQGITDSIIILTVDKAVEIALKNNYDVQLARKNVNRAEAQISEAYANVLPTIKGVIDYNRNIKSPVLFIPPNSPFNPASTPQTISLGADNSYNIAATLDQTLFSLKVNTAISIANDYYNYYKNSEKATEDEIIFQVKKTFYLVLLAQELVKVSRTGYDVAEENFENVKAQFKQGVSSEYDYLRAEVQLANVNPVLIQSQNNFEMAKNSLKNLLAIDLSQKVEVQGEFKLVPADPVMLQLSNEILIKENPLLTALEFQASVLEKNIKLQRADYFPTLSAYANYIWQTEDNSFNFNDYFWANTIMVGLRLSIPIFDGFGRSARIDQAIIDRELLDITRNKTEEGLRIQLVQAELQMKEAEQRIKAQEKSLTQAERAVDIAQSRYKNGIGTQLEILDTQSSLTLSQTNYSQAIYDYLVAKAQWENIIGSSQNKNNN